MENSIDKKETTQTCNIIIGADLNLRRSCWIATDSSSSSSSSFSFQTFDPGDRGGHGTSQRRNLLLREGQLLFDLQLKLANLLLQLLLLLQNLLHALLKLRRGSRRRRSLRRTGRVRRRQNLLLKLLQLGHILL